MIVLVDYGVGNIKAILNVYKLLNTNILIAKKPEQLEKASKIILAGVGAFDESMSRLNKSGMREILNQKVLKDHVPVLGICVGMQMMACSSEEGKEKGLCWFENSKVIKIDDLAKYDLNTLKPKSESRQFIESLNDNKNSLNRSVELANRLIKEG